MKRKKGFTLIELLAVIVILAIIALIAIPVVLKLIDNARKGAARASAYSIREEAKLYYQKALVTNTDNFHETSVEFSRGNIMVTPTITDIKFDLDGIKPSSGQITITVDGKVSGEVTINGFTCIIPYTGKIDCGESSSNGNENLTASDIILENGTSVQDALDELASKLN